jgi:diguanylate cyclase (GGDEF)-like protein
MNVLRKMLKVLKTRNREYRQIDRMVADLHACRSFPEVYEVIANYGRELLSGMSGALYMRRNGVYERVIAWGRMPRDKRSFTLEECRCLQRMKAHIVESLGALRCPHAVRAGAASMCLPLLVDGEALGVLHLEGRRWAGSAAHGADLKPRLAEKMTAHCAQKVGELRLRETLYDQSVRDALTNLFNRRYMEESLRRELAQRARQPVSLIMLDIDHFKKFNSKFAHTGADELLRAFGAFLQRHVRGADIACRYGGDEFVLILPGANPEVARRRADKIRKEAKRLCVNVHERPLGHITISLGVAASDEHSCRAEALLEAAAMALRQAKEDGRDRVLVADRGRDEEPRQVFDVHAGYPPRARRTRVLA